MPDRILIIDDDVAIGSALQIRLQAAGYAAVRTASGEDGLASARGVRPDAIILDVRMPGMSGFEVNLALKDDPELASIPVIFLSANVVDATRERALAAGAAAFLCKPYEPAEVLSAIRDALACATDSPPERPPISSPLSCKEVTP